MNKMSTFALIAAVVIGLTSPVLAQSRVHNGQNGSTQLDESYGSAYTPQYVPGFGNTDGWGFNSW